MRRLRERPGRISASLSSSALRDAMDRLIRVFSETLELAADRLSDASSPANTPEWDSLATVNLTLAIEDEFRVKLSTKEIMAMTSIGLARKVLAQKGATF
jgi:acyl carrier protein